MVKNTLTRQFHISLICLLLLSLLFHGVCLGSASSAATAGHTENKLCELALKGQLSNELISEFYQYALNNAKEQIQAPDEFWDWLAKNKELQQGLLVGLHPDYNPHVVKNLQELRRAFGAKVEQYPQLALAFSFIYGAAKEDSIRRQGLSSWVGKNRDVPTCVESFGYYINNKDILLYPLNQLPWPLMLNVADNDVPLSERQWVLDRYKGRSLDSLGRLHSEPKYVKGAYAKKRKKLDGAPMSLPRIISDGGVCSQLSYYASRVLKCFGVPSVRLLERAHAFEGWVTGDEKLKVKVGAAYGGRKNGYFFCPLTRDKHYEYEFKLLVSAIDLSYDRYLKSIIACHVFKMLPDDSKKQAMGLLEAAIKTNPYVVEPWFEYAQACGEGVFTLETGWKLYGRARIDFPGHPELSCAILNILTTAQLKTAEVIGEDKYQQTKNKFNGTVLWLRKQNRVDLALDVFKTHADYLAGAKGANAAIDNSLAWLKLKKFKIDTQKRFFTHIYNIAVESKDDKAIEKLLRTEYRRRLLLTRNCSEKTYAQHYSSYAQVAKAYIAYYNKAGDQTKASQIYLELDKCSNENLNFGDLREVITQGRTLGAIEEQVTRIAPNVQGCYVWRILYNLPKGMNVRIRVKHAVAGKDGAFYLTAWSDNDGNGVPDTKIGISPLMTVKNKDEWSDWEFISAGKTVFVGMTMKTKASLYYQKKGDLEGYYGLSDRVFYSRVFDGKPQSSVQPRYVNIRVEILGK